MVNIYTGSNSMLPIGMVQDYNNTMPSRAVNLYRALATSPNPTTFTAENQTSTSFAQAIYANGPYSLLRPNATSDILARNIDLIA